MHLPDHQRFKVGVSKVGARRVAVVGSGRSLVTVETLKVPNRFLAQLVEIAVLRLTDPWRILYPEYHHAGGYTEMWSDDGPTVDLALSRPGCHPHGHSPKSYGGPDGAGLGRLDRQPAASSPDRR